jgi:hypothetical protein
VKRLIGPAVVVVGVAAAVRVVFAADYLNYDARYALLWARDLRRGHTPDFDAPFASTPHPLSILWSAFGEHVVVWLTLLAFGLVVYLAYRLAAELFSPAAGVVTALVVLTRPVLERDVVLGYQDVPFAALILAAALLEAQRARRGLPVLALLAVAGLLRPEAWALAGIYWLYLGRPWRLAGWVVAAPLLWALTDLAVTGDALHSLHGTSDLAETVGRRRDIGDAPRWTVQYYAYTLRQPLGVGIPIGIAFALRHRRRPAVLLLAVAGAMTVIFAANPLFGLPLIARYVRTPAILLAVFFGVAVAGWALLPRTRERRVWQALAVVTVAVFAAFAPQNLRLLRHERAVFQRNAKLYADLRALGSAETVRALARRCGPLLAADHRPVAHLRYWLHGDPGSVGTVEGSDAVPRLLLVPKPNTRNRLFWRANFPDVRPPAGAVSAYDNRSWRLYSTC